MSLVGYKSKNHPQQVGKRGARPEIDDRATTPEVFAPLNDRFGFTIDVAASAHNTKCERYYDEADNGLTQRWNGERVWCNPPHSDIRPWVEKAWEERTRGNWNLYRDLIVMLVPANRTEQKWWQELVERQRHIPDGSFRTEFLPGRIRFIAPGADAVGPNERPPYGCCLLIWDTLTFKSRLIEAGKYVPGHD